MKFISDVEKERVDVWLSQKSEELSRTFIKRISEDGGITINGKIIKCSQRLKIGDIIEILVPPPKTLEVIPQEIDLNIVFEDNDIIVVDKPKGMVVHPGAGNYEGTLVNALLAKYKDKLSMINGVIRPGIVHRIDKDTTGILVVARNNLAHEKLATLFKAHNIKRVYVALVEGTLASDSGKIDAPIGRHINDRKKMSVQSNNSRRAVTYFQVIKRYDKQTLVEVTLETGRTHQIRVHMAYIGHPVVGDMVYGRKKNSFQIEGQLLHAKILGFEHPTTGNYIEFSAPLPKHFEDVLAHL